jgi:hypothetical protein
MNTKTLIPFRRALPRALLLLLPMSAASADAVTDWNARANALLVEARMGTPPAVRTMAVVQTAVHAAVAEATRPGSAPGTVDAAVAAANRIVLLKAVPTHKDAIETAYRTALIAVADADARNAGSEIGERAAGAVLATRANDGASAPEAYRPHTTPGAYVPTAVPAVPQWASRQPWLLDSPAQFRPAAPPALESAIWARDFEEVKALGAKASTRRSEEQTAIARFWEFSMPGIYHGLVASVASRPGRDALANARLYAVVAQAMDDALISVMDAKYHYNFWRPMTAIRNGDIDGHPATERDATWTPLIETPAHPEYPCAHCILAATVGTVLQAEITPGTILATASPSAQGATRRWRSTDSLMREVADARVFDGVHYRNSTEVGLAMGQRIGEIAVARLQAAPAN